MAADQAQARFDQRLRDVGPAERMRVHERMYRLAFEMVWAQADRAGPMSELERARSLLRRLYPDLEGPRLEAILVRLESDWTSGTWPGLLRPAAGSSAAGRRSTR